MYPQQSSDHFLDDTVSPHENHSIGKSFPTIAYRPLKDSKCRDWVLKCFCWHWNLPALEGVYINDHFAATGIGLHVLRALCKHPSRSVICKKKFGAFGLIDGAVSSKFLDHLNETTMTYLDIAFDNGVKEVLGKALKVVLENFSICIERESQYHEYLDFLKEVKKLVTRRGSASSK